MPGSLRFLRFFLPLLLLSLGTGAFAAGGALRVQPENLALTGVDPEHGLLVTWVEPDGHQSDVTVAVRYTSASAAVVEVDGKGHCHAHGDGATSIAIEYQGLRASCAVTSMRSPRQRLLLSTRTLFQSSRGLAATRAAAMEN